MFVKGLLLTGIYNFLVFDSNEISHGCIALEIMVYYLKVRGKDQMALRKSTSKVRLKLEWILDVSLIFFGLRVKSMVLAKNKQVSSFRVFSVCSHKRCLEKNDENVSECIIILKKKC